MLLIFILVTLSLNGSKGRTLDGGKGLSITRPHHPMETILKDRQGGGGGGVLAMNEIHSAGIKKSDGSDYISSTRVAITDDLGIDSNSGTVLGKEDTLLYEVDANEEEQISYERMDPNENDEHVTFDENVFHGESDVVVIMRRMYESLTNRLNLLKSRVSNVEQTARDILARLTVMDCSDLKQGMSESGTYTFHLEHNGKRPVTVFCDMETDGGGWTVVQRRLPHSKAVNFDRGWHDYKVGFGDANTDYWVGLENIYVWTNTKHYELRIDLSDFEGETAYAKYTRFYVEDESEGYRLHVSDYTGTAGDCLGNEGNPDNFTSNGMMFTTYDEDHDTSHEINCAKYWKIGGWWFNRCSWANLNGPYREQGEGDGIGINWHMWRNKEYLRSSTMMIRPINSP